MLDFPDLGLVSLLLFKLYSIFETPLLQVLAV